MPEFRVQDTLSTLFSRANDSIGEAEHDLGTHRSHVLPPGRSIIRRSTGAKSIDDRKHETQFDCFRGRLPAVGTRATLILSFRPHEGPSYLQVPLHAKPSRASQTLSSRARHYFLHIQSNFPSYSGKPTQGCKPASPECNRHLATARAIFSSLLFLSAS